MNMTNERERVEDWSPYTCRINAESNVQIRPGQYQASSAVLAWIWRLLSYAMGWPYMLHAICFVFPSSIPAKITQKPTTPTSQVKMRREKKRRQKRKRLKSCRKQENGTSTKRVRVIRMISWSVDSAVP